MDAAGAEVGGGGWRPPWVGSGDTGRWAPRKGIGIGPGAAVEAEPRSDRPSSASHEPRKVPRGGMTEGVSKDWNPEDVSGNPPDQRDSIVGDEPPAPAGS